MSHKQELLEIMRQARAALETAVNVYNRNLDAALDDDWRLRDALAHIAVWERMAVRKLAGVPLPLGEEIAARKPWNMNAFNEAMRDLWRTRTDDEILAELAAAHPPLVSVVEAAREDDCAPGGKVWRQIDQDSAGHYHHHFPTPNLMTGRRPKKTGKEE